MIELSRPKLLEKRGSRQYFIALVELLLQSLQLGTSMQSAKGMIENVVVGHSSPWKTTTIHDVVSFKF